VELVSEPRLVVLRERLEAERADGELRPLRYEPAAKPCAAAA
jgi:hypothetical protein